MANSQNSNSSNNTPDWLRLIAAIIVLIAAIITLAITLVNAYAGTGN